MNLKRLFLMLARTSSVLTLVWYTTVYSYQLEAGLTVAAAITAAVVYLLIDVLYICGKEKRA